MSEKEDFPTITQFWNENIEKTLKDIEDSCSGYKWMNIFAARKNEKKYNFLMYTSIILGPVTGILSTISESSENINILVTIFSFLTGIISAITKFSEFGEKSLAYKNISSKYASLETNIKRQISLAKTDRVNPGKYLEWISSSYDELFSSSPLISDDIYEEWLDFAKRNSLGVSNLNNLNKNRQGSIYSGHSQEEKTSHVEVKINEEPISNNFMDGKMRYELSRLKREI